MQLIAAVHESASGTFETCRPGMGMSVSGGEGRKSSADGQNEANDPDRTFGRLERGLKLPTFGSSSSGV
jgi:hypothetical protein